MLIENILKFLHFKFLVKVVKKFKKSEVILSLSISKNIYYYRRGTFQLSAILNKNILNAYQNLHVFTSWLISKTVVEFTISIPILKFLI